MRKTLRRLWCKLTHHGLWKTEYVAFNTYRRRCLECGEIFLFEVRMS